MIRNVDIPIAVKVLKPHFAGDETFESRFRREASVAAKLRHPNIVRILAVGRELRLSICHGLPADMPRRPSAVMGRFQNHCFCVRESMSQMRWRSPIARSDPPGYQGRQYPVRRTRQCYRSPTSASRARIGLVKQTGTNMVVGTPQYFSSGAGERS